MVLESKLCVCTKQELIDNSTIDNKNIYQGFINYYEQYLEERECSKWLIAFYKFLLLNEDQFDYTKFSIINGGTCAEVSLLPEDAQRWNLIYFIAPEQIKTEEDFEAAVRHFYNGPEE